MRVIIVSNKVKNCCKFSSLNAESEQKKKSGKYTAFPRGNARQ